MTNSLTHLVGESSLWEAIISLAGREIPRISRYLKVRYRVDKSLPPVRILSHANPVHVLPTCFFKVHFNITRPSAFPTRTLYELPHVGVSFSAHHIIFDLISRTLCGKEYNYEAACYAVFSTVARNFCEYGMFYTIFLFSFVQQSFVLSATLRLSDVMLMCWPDDFIIVTVSLTVWFISRNSPYFCKECLQVNGNLLTLVPS